MNESTDAHQLEAWAAVFLSPLARWPPDVPRLIALLFGAAVLIFAFRPNVAIGEQAGWQVAPSTFAAEAWKEIEESWHG